MGLHLLQCESLFWICDQNALDEVLRFVAERVEMHVRVGILLQVEVGDIRVSCVFIFAREWSLPRQQFER